MDVDSATFLFKRLAKPISLCALSQLMDTSIFPKLCEALFTCLPPILPHIGSLRYLVEVHHAPNGPAKTFAVDANTRCIGMLPLCFRPARVPRAVLIGPFR